MPLLCYHMAINSAVKRNLQNEFNNWNFFLNVLRYNKVIFIFAWRIKVADMILTVDCSTFIFN